MWREIHLGFGLSLHEFREENDLDQCLCNTSVCLERDFVFEPAITYIFWLKKRENPIGGKPI